MAKVKPWCNDFYKAVDLEFIFRRSDAKRPGDHYYIEDGTGKVMEIHRCPFCDKRHW